MAIGYNQIICNARNLATTMNGIINALAEGVTIIGRPKILQLANNDDLLISWYEGTGGGGGGGGGGDEPSGDTEALKGLIERTITDLTIPDGVTKIGDWAFFRAETLESVHFPSSVLTIGGAAFSNCAGLKEVELNEGLTGINAGGFLNATSLASIDLPSTVYELNAQAFQGATALKTIVVRRATPPYLGTDALKNVPADAAIYVPAASVDAYKSASGWNARASYIQAIPS